MANRRDLTIKPRKTKTPAPVPADDDLFEPDKPTARRRRRHGRSLWRMVFRLAVVAVVIAGGVWVVRNWDTIAPDSLLVWIDETLGGGHTGDGYPVDMAGSTVQQMTETSEGLVLVTDTAYRMFNASGGEVVNRPHGFSSPMLKTAGKWALLYDAGSYRLRLESRTGTAYERTTEAHLVDGAVNTKGMVALVTDSTQGYLSEVVVYNRKQEQVYRWYSSELHVLGVALSNDGTSMAVIGVSSQAGYLRSSLLLFDLKKSEPVARYDDTGVLYTDVGYFPGGTVLAVGDTAARVVNESGTIDQTHAYEDYRLVGSAVGELSAGLVLQPYGSTDTYRLLVLNPSGDQAYTEDFTGTFRDVAATEEGLLVLTAGKLYVAGAAGFEETLDVIRDGRLTSTLGSQRLVLGLTALEAY